MFCPHKTNALGSVYLDYMVYPLPYWKVSTLSKARRYWKTYLTLKCLIHVYTRLGIFSESKCFSQPEQPLQSCHENTFALK